MTVCTVFCFTVKKYIIVINAITKTFSLLTCHMLEGYQVKIVSLMSLSAFQQEVNQYRLASCT